MSLVAIPDGKPGVIAAALLAAVPQLTKAGIAVVVNVPSEE